MTTKRANLDALAQLLARAEIDCRAAYRGNSTGHAYMAGRLDAYATAYALTLTGQPSDPHHGDAAIRDALIALTDDTLDAAAYGTPAIELVALLNTAVRRRYAAARRAA